MTTCHAYKAKFCADIFADVPHPIMTQNCHVSKLRGDDGGRKQDEPLDQRFYVALVGGRMAKEGIVRIRCVFNPGHGHNKWCHGKQ